MKKKTTKTPSVDLKLFRAFVPSVMAVSLKASFYATTTTLATPLTWFKSTEGKTPRFALKNIKCSPQQEKAPANANDAKEMILYYWYSILWFFSEAQAERGFSSDDVSSCKATGVDVRAVARAQALRHQAMAAARKLEELKHQKRGFRGFCLNLKRK